LLDTHVLLWWIADDPKLRADVRNTVTDPDHDILVSAASIWEAAIKRAVGKLRFETPVLLDSLQRGGLRVLPITAEHVLAAGICRDTMTIRSTACWWRKRWRSVSP
jgi:PIN domain nuclease of toxin-antitoxin system